MRNTTTNKLIVAYERIRKLYKLDEPVSSFDEVPPLKVKDLLEYYDILEQCLPKKLTCETKKERTAALSQIKDPLRELDWDFEVREAGTGLHCLRCFDELLLDVDDLDCRLCESLREKASDEANPAVGVFKMIEHSVTLELRRRLEPAKFRYQTFDLDIYIDSDNRIPTTVEPYQVKATFLGHGNSLGNLLDQGQKPKRKHRRRSR